MYKAVSSYSGRANIYVSSTFSITKEVEPNKKEEKNRFLTPKTTETITGESDFDLNELLTFSTKEYRSSTEAEKEYKINRANTYNNQLDTYVNHVVSKVNKHINIKFGFEPRSQRFILWILDSKEEEGQIQKDAIEAVKIIFNEMKADVPLDAIEEKLLPIISYFVIFSLLNTKGSYCTNIASFLLSVDTKIIIAEIIAKRVVAGAVLTRTPIYAIRKTSNSNSIYV